MDERGKILNKEPEVQILDSRGEVAYKSLGHVSSSFNGELQNVIVPDAHELIGQTMKSEY